MKVRRVVRLDDRAPAEGLLADGVTELDFVDGRLERVGCDRGRLVGSAEPVRTAELPP